MKSLSLSKPHIIIMVGIPGSGKSFFANYFAETFNSPIVSFSALHHELFSHQNLSNDERLIIDNLGDHILDELLKTKQTVVFDGHSDTRTDRQSLGKKAHLAGYETLFVWVQTESLAAKSRVTKAAKNQIPPMTVDQFETALKHFSPPHTLEKAVVISGKHTHASQLKVVLGRLVETRASLPISGVVPQRSDAHQKILIR